MRVVAHQGDTLDAVVWRHLGQTAGVVEAVLEAQPHLADLGPILPQGTPVTLPDTTPAPARVATVQLWD